MATNRLVVKEEVAVYASVLFDAAHTAGGQEAVLEVREQMGEIIRLMRADLELTQSLSNPDFTPAQRKELVEGTFADCHLALREVLAVMAERGQADLLPRVFDAYRELLGDKLGPPPCRSTTDCANSLRKKPRPIWDGARCCASASMRPSWAASSWMLTATTLTRA